MTATTTEPIAAVDADDFSPEMQNGADARDVAPPSAPQRPPPGIPPFPVWRFSLEEYHRMAEAGFLTEEDRVELLDGWLVPRMTHNPRHDGTIDRHADALGAVLPKSWRIRIQQAITIDSEPEPDLAVVRRLPGGYMVRHPGPDDIGLIVEVADTSLGVDRWKRGIYARARIPIYWLVNLSRNQIEVYSEPSGPADEPGYAKHTDYQAGDEIPLVLDGQEIARIAVADLLP